MLIPLLVNYRLQIIKGNKPNLAQKFASEVTYDPYNKTKMTQADKVAIAALFMRGAILTLHGRSADGAVASYYSPYFDLAFVTRLVANPTMQSPRVIDGFTASGAGVDSLMSKEFHDGQPSGLNIFKRAKKRIEALGSVFHDPARYDQVKEAVLARNDIAAMSRSADAVLYGLSKLTRVEKQGLQEFATIVESGQTARLRTSAVLQVDPAFSLENWPPQIRPRLSVVFAWGTNIERTMYLVSENQPGLAVKVATTVKGPKLAISSAHLINVMSAMPVMPQ